MVRRAEGDGIYRIYTVGWQLFLIVLEVFTSSNYGAFCSRYITIERAPGLPRHFKVLRILAFFPRLINEVRLSVIINEW